MKPCCVVTIDPESRTIVWKCNPVRDIQAMRTNFEPASAFQAKTFLESLLVCQKAHKLRTKRPHAAICPLHRR